jgi:plasmid stabilization system protein ParE
MNYRVEVAESAKADIREKARWLRAQASPAVADRWLSGLNKAISSLGSRPLRCPIAAESDKFPRPIREHDYGRRRSGRHRILFEIRESVVIVLYVRHSAQDEVEP